MPICCMLAYVVATMLEMYICMWGLHLVGAGLVVAVLHGGMVVLVGVDNLVALDDSSVHDNHTVGAMVLGLVGMVVVVVLELVGGCFVGLVLDFGGGFVELV